MAGPERFSIIPIGLDLDRFLEVERADGASLRERLGVVPGERLAVFAGRLVPIKRVDVLLQAMRIARDAGAPLRLAIAGDGPERPMLEALCSELGLQRAVVFLGFHDDLPRLAAASDLAVLSSDNEGTPVALIEAAAAGRPAVATDVGGVSDIVTASTGTLVPPGDAEMFGEALHRVVCDAERLEASGRAARDHVRSMYTADRMLDDVSGLYEELLAAASRRVGAR